MQVDVPLHVVDAGVLLDRVREPDRRADLGDDLRPQRLAFRWRARPGAAAGSACATRGRSTRRSRRTRGAPRRWRAPCPRRRRRRPGPIDLLGRRVDVVVGRPAAASTSFPSISIRDSAVDASVMVSPSGQAFGYREAYPGAVIRRSRMRIAALDLGFELVPPARRRRASRRHASSRSRARRTCCASATRWPRRPHHRPSGRAARRDRAAPEAARRRGRARPR